MSALKTHRQAYYELQDAMNHREMDYNHMSAFHSIAMSKKANATNIEPDPDHMNVHTGGVKPEDAHYGTASFSASWHDASQQVEDNSVKNLAHSDQPHFFNDGRNTREEDPVENTAEVRTDTAERLETVNNPKERQLKERIDLSAMRRENLARMQQNEARTKRQRKMDYSRRHRNDISDVERFWNLPPDENEGVYVNSRIRKRVQREFRPQKAVKMWHDPTHTFRGY